MSNDERWARGRRLPSVPMMIRSMTAHHIAPIPMMTTSCTRHPAPCFIIGTDAGRRAGRRWIIIGMDDGGGQRQSNGPFFGRFFSPFLLVLNRLFFGKRGRNFARKSEKRPRQKLQTKYKKTSNKFVRCPQYCIHRTNLFDVFKYFV